MRHQFHLLFDKYWSKGDKRKKSIIIKTAQRKSEGRDGPELEKYVENMSLVAGLMATITFAAVFTMPGG